MIVDRRPGGKREPGLDYIELNSSESTGSPSMHMVRHRSNPSHGGLVSPVRGPVIDDDTLFDVNDMGTYEGVDDGDNIALVSMNEGRSGGIQKPIEQDGPTTGGRIRDTGTLASFMNLMKSFVGSGILGLPAAFKYGGFLATMFVLVSVGLMAGTCNLMLVRCKEALARRGVVSFSDIGIYTYGRRMGHLIDFLLIFTQFGFCCVYLVFVSQNLSEFLPLSRNQTLFAMAPVFIGLSWIRSMNYIYPFSMLANATILVGLLSVSATAFVQLRDRVLPNQSYEIDEIVNWSDLAVTFGMAVYAFEGIGVVIPCETAMKNPKAFPNVILAVMVLATCLYCAFGSICYLAWGKHTSDQILENMKEFAAAAGGNWAQLETVVRACLIFTITATFPIQLYVVTDIVEEEILFKGGYLTRRFQILKQYAFRTAVVLLAISVAWLVPNFGPLIGLIGAFGAAALQFIIPSLFYFRVFPDMGLFRRCLCCLFIAVGVIGGTMGTIDSVKQLIRAAH
eukprot:comp20532_c0_seq1/m.26320 comp20532_c0_seq1/g.26320  ORF comp20532_c0_seq1/g.26320 comp20532_c0_seq1/m.26320 type:complete len:508 (-) comp20532_c0_seq1:422-1945(-)